MKLSREELERYDRQILLFGEDGQIKLKKSTICIIGVGGLGSLAAIYAVAAGFGKVIIVDKERVELSNLNRQILHWTTDIGKEKVESAVEKLKKLNPNVEIRAINTEITEENVDEIIKDADIVLDCLDNWETRHLLNRVCVRQKKPLIHAGIYGLDGQLMVVIPGKTPCLYCVFGGIKEKREKFPVVGVTPAIMASLQVLEAIKLVTGYGEPFLNKLLIFEGYHTSFSEIPIERRKDCPVCGGIT
ncbi:MAG: HesA/MoeB/ThiF family protein [Candidatus Njordarchaeales archaeon]